MKVRRIIFPTDFSKSASAALGRALFLAERFEAELHMLHAVVLHDFDPNDPEHVFPDSEAVLRHLFDIADSNMASLLKQHGREPVTISEVKRRGVSVSEVILAYSEEIDADLIVMGTHGRRGPARIFLGSVTEEVVRRAECPVLTVRQGTEGASDEGIPSILVPVDFSEPSKMTIRYAEQLAHVFHAGLELVHVVEEIPYPYYYVPPDPEAIASRLDRAGQALAALAEETLSESVRYSTTVLSGRVATEILDHARSSRSGLMVIGTHGLTGLERALIGSTAEQVIREAECAVFVVKSKGKAIL